MDAANAKLVRDWIGTQTTLPMDIENAMLALCDPPKEEEPALPPHPFEPGDVVKLRGWNAALEMVASSTCYVGRSQGDKMVPIPAVVAIWYDRGDRLQRDMLGADILELVYRPDKPADLEAREAWVIFHASVPYDVCATREQAESEIDGDDPHQYIVRMRGIVGEDA
jgi:hypothetical protein